MPNITTPRHQAEEVGAAVLTIVNEAETPDSGGIEGTASRGVDSFGVKGKNHDPASTGVGVYGEHTGDGIGVRGNCLGVTGIGVMGAAGIGEGLEAVPGSGYPIGVYGMVPETGYAGFFQGDVEVTGTLTKTAGAFRIDHPLEPESKYLYHSFVESPEMICIYSDTIQLNQEGEAEVSLPMWFGALNKDFRYQLTAIGGSAPELHIAQEVEENKFRIAGGQPGMKVSWQVTGIRNDLYAQRYPIPVEEDKGIYKGKFLHPELYDRGPESGIGLSEEHLYVERCFKITQKTLDTFRFEMLPDDIVSQLESIKDQTITGTANFLEVLRTTIGPRETNHYQGMILRYSACKPEKEKKKHPIREKKDPRLAENT